MTARVLPVELRASLERARHVEGTAATQAQRTAAITATARLVIACLDAGRRMFELAPVVGLKRSTAERRVEAARRRGLDSVGIHVPAPPAGPPPSRPQLLQAPAGEREWLTAGEAAALAGVDRSTISRWARAGALAQHLADRPPGGRCTCGPT